MNAKLIFLDIDGTLTPPGANDPPESAVAAIHKARAAGHKVFLCSGRNIPMLKPLMDKYPFDGAIGSAGGIVVVGDQILYDCPMEREDFETAMRLLKETGVYRTIEARTGTWCDEGMGEFLVKQNNGNSEVLRWRETLEKDLGFRPMHEYDGSPIYKIVYMCETEAQLVPARNALGGRFNFVIQDSFSRNCLNGEMINRRFDKGKGIRIVAEHLGYRIEDSIGFGDSMNDLEMIETVGYSVCMENGSSTLKTKADYVCPPVEDDGLAHAFEELGLV